MPSTAQWAFVKGKTVKKSVKAAGNRVAEFDTKAPGDNTYGTIALMTNHGVCESLLGACETHHLQVVEVWHREHGNRCSMLAINDKRQPFTYVSTQANRVKPVSLAESVRFYARELETSYASQPHHGRGKWLALVANAVKKGGAR